MSKLDQQIALKLQSISLRQQRMLRHRRELRDHSLDYCRQPSTLFKAALTGFVLALLIPPGRVTRPQADKQTILSSFIVEELAKLLPVLLFYSVRGMLNGSSGAASVPPQNPE